MKIPEYKYKFDELIRWYNRANRAKKKLSMEDSFHEYRDYLKSFFRVCYELKENLKRDKNLKGLDFRTKVEDFINRDKFLTYAMDIANELKHTNMENPKSSDKIGAINVGVNLDKGETELTLMINNKKFNALNIAKRCKERWEDFFNLYDL